jgi:SAM-dependent methyltransferase
MKELSKSIPRRQRDPRFLTKYFVGEGIDIGGAPDPLSLYAEFFPLMKSVKIWDLDDGDAQFMEGVPDDSFDFINSSHCLEHLRDPGEGLKNWLRIVKPGGYIVILVPDEDLYEQGQFPSTYNRDHKVTFTINKKTSWSDCSINLIDLLKPLSPQAAVEKIELLDASFRYELPRYDQTSTPVGECAIEIIIRKRSVREMATGMIERSTKQPEEKLRIHYNQYKHDHTVMKQSNAKVPPFTNKGEI